MLDKLFDFLETEYGKGVITGIAISVVICSVICLLFKGYSQYNTNTSSTISTISGNQQHIINQLGAVGAGVSNAQNAITAASERIERSEAILETSKLQLDAIQKRLDECRKLAKAEHELIINIGEADRSRTPAGEKN